jgi:hypothetical protein
MRLRRAVLLACKLFNFSEANFLLAIPFRNPPQPPLSKGGEGGFPGGALSQARHIFWLRLRPAGQI